MANPDQGMIIVIEGIGVEITGQAIGQGYNPTVYHDLTTQALRAWREAYDHVYPDGQPLGEDIEADILAGLEDDEPCQ